ncbi:MAG TPA: argininosuccinate lyase [Deltaproteobacteria bacterium]|nr:argininosuccinate lyase [Deltaproteobacteria bacterium]HPR56486.1 argininosuccinate lyase [Deltaproteobacteria bacterium]HXK48442.1 argininosuccinate lyase [Deltaproteobacteria bacterium]
MKDKPWSGRFTEGTDALVEAFTASVDVDARLYLEDIEGSIAHARMLSSCGLITPAEADDIVKGLRSIRQDIEEGAFTFDPALEDVHMNIETELTRRIGETGKKLHTARSRNDQVATDLRLHAGKALRDLAAGLRAFMAALLDKASGHVDTIIPGMTHLQHAQPVSLAHHLLAYFEMALRDHQRIVEALRRVEVSPLGSAALAGTPHPIDRRFTADALGFSMPARNSLDAVSDRDFACETAFVCSMVMMHLSRLAEEIIIWNAQPFSFVDLPDAFCTGSSIMPQKKNPDVAELVRGRTGGVFGNLVALLAMMKGLPLAYNRDMQEDKKPLFECLDTALASVRVMTGLISGMNPNREILERSLRDGFITATDMADYLTAKGMPFRDAHRVTGEIVAHCMSRGKGLVDLELDELKGFSVLFEQDIFAALDPAVSVDRRKSLGGTARDNVRSALTEARAFLEALTHEK